jgi:hypothetical protein
MTFLMVLLVVNAILCGIFGSWVAGQKGRGPAEGLTLGALFGLFGVLIEACLPVIAHPGPPPPPTAAELATQQAAAAQRRANQLADDARCVQRQIDLAKWRQAEQDKYDAKCRAFWQKVFKVQNAIGNAAKSWWNKVSHIFTPVLLGLLLAVAPAFAAILFFQQRQPQDVAAAVLDDPHPPDVAVAPPVALDHPQPVVVVAPVDPQPPVVAPQPIAPAQQPARIAPEQVNPAEAPEVAIPTEVENLVSPKARKARAQIILEAGKILQEQGNRKSALEQYRRLVTEFADTSAAEDAAERIKAINLLLPGAFDHIPNDKARKALENAKNNTTHLGALQIAETFLKKAEKEANGDQATLDEVKKLRDQIATIKKNAP